ncbi:MAG: hypothetical protein V1809_11320 [Planctomycetota bacterium]
MVQIRIKAPDIGRVWHLDSSGSIPTTPETLRIEAAKALGHQYSRLGHLEFALIDNGEVRLKASKGRRWWFFWKE